jgi:hypothetical protein
LRLWKGEIFYFKFSAFPICCSHTGPFIRNEVAAAWSQ